MRGAAWLDTLFRLVFMPTLMFFSGSALVRNIRLLWKELSEGGGFRW